MKQLQNVELSGKFVLAYVEGVKQLSATFEQQALDILAENGISDPRPDEFYPVPDFAESLEETVDTVGPATLQKVGVSVTKAVDFPTDVDSVEEAFGVANDMLDKTHKGGDQSDYGQYRFEQLDDNEWRAAATEDYPYPAPFVRGVFEGIMEMYTPDDVPSETYEI